MASAENSSLPLVLVAEELSVSAAVWLAQWYRVEQVHFSSPGFDRLLARAQGLVVRTYMQVDEKLLYGAPALRVVGRAGVGLDRIDVAACRARGVEVVHTPDANSQAVAEYVFALVHDAIRPRLMIDKAIDSVRWNALRKELTAPRQLNELTFGVLGLGRIGGRVAKIAKAYGAEVLYYDLRGYAVERCGAVLVSRDELLARSDVLSLHVDAREANRHLVSTEFVSNLRPTVILINTARGMVIDAAALGAFLWANPRATALIDVHDPEPFTTDYPLLALKNAHLAPHIAAATVAAHESMSWVVRDVRRVLVGENPEFIAPAVQG